jgi:hypothetical protein
MIRHKYTVYIHADYTEGIFGNSFKELLPDLGVVSKKTEVVSIQSDRELVKEEQEHILDLYRDGLSKIELPKGKIVPTIKYMGTIEVTKTEPDEINILEL